MKNSKRGISFVIPAKNEEAEIPITIKAIQQFASGLIYEIIVINHNSSDRTGAVAESLGARVFDKVGGTIGAARIFGAEKSIYNVLIFVDAHVSLSYEWQKEIGAVLDKVGNNYLYMTGSHCVPPSEGSWLEKYWFSSFSQEVTTTHLGTGHMIMSSKLFEEVGGFSEELRTGEDYDICQRAKSIGATLENNPRLLVFHRDYPQNIVDFFKRERWHGRGDAQNLNAFFSSKVSMSALAHAIFHVFFLLALFFSDSSTVKIFTFMCLFLIPFLAAKYKFKNIKFSVFMLNIMVFYVYFWARLCSVF
ncbi:glycosyltransferase [Cellvibrio sp.]